MGDKYDGDGREPDRSEPDEQPSEMDAFGTYNRLRDWYGVDFEHTQKWRKAAKIAYGFAAGEQWDAKDKAALEEQGRPCITFNRVQSIVKSVAGIEINSRHETIYIPRGTTPGEVKANELLSAASQWMGDQCDAEDEQSQAFQDTIITGMGWTEARMDYERDPDGGYIEERIDPLEMVWDRSARAKNLTDARRLFRVRKMSLGEAMERFEGIDPGELDAVWAVGADDTGEVKPIEERRRKRSEGEPPSTHDEVHIVHAQWVETECYYRLPDPQTGQIIELDEDRYEAISERAKASGVPMRGVKQTRRVYKQAFLGASILGEVMEAPYPNGYSWNCITGEIDRNAGTWYGLVKLMEDPQRWANKWLSQTLHILNTTAKGGIIAEADAFKDQRAAQDTYAQPDAITWANKGAISGGKIMQKPGAGIPTAYVNLLEFAISSIRDVTGVNLELLGMRDANQAGILEAQRKQAAMTILATLFDSLRRFRKNVGRVRLHYIQAYLSDGRLIRIAGQDGMMAVPLVRDRTAGHYEVIVDDAPTSPNAKQETWATIQQVLPAFREILTPEAVISILEYSPLPSKLVDAFKKMANPPPTPEAQAQKRVMLEAAVAKIARDKAGADRDTATAEATRAKGLLDLVNAGAIIGQQAMTGAVGNVMSPEPWRSVGIDEAFVVDPQGQGGPQVPPLPTMPAAQPGPMLPQLPTQLPIGNGVSQ